MWKCCGYTLKEYARITWWVKFIASIGAFIYVCAQGNFLYSLLGFIAFCIFNLLSYVFDCAIYGYGRIIENSKYLRRIPKEDSNNVE